MKKKYPLATEDVAKKEREESARRYREGVLIKKAFKILMTTRKNELSMYIDPFIEELENGKKYLISDGEIAKINKIIKKLKKVMKRIDRFNREIDFIPCIKFKRQEDNEN